MAKGCENVMRIEFASQRSVLNKIGAFLIVLFTIPGIGFAGERISVFVSVAPQKYFVQKIGKEWVSVQVMVQPGANPATYEPKPRQMANISKAQVYFAIGVPFEEIWLDRIAATNADMRVVRTDRDIAKMPMAAHYHYDEKQDHPAAHDGHHAHGDHGSRRGENHHGLDPHIWLSPPLVKIQIRSILSTLQAIDPIHRDAYDTNYRQFVAEIDRLDRRIRKIFEGRRGLRFIVFHPAWGYFARTYGIDQVPIEIEGKAPKPAQLKELIDHARAADIKVVFVQPQFSTKSARLVAKEIGGQVAFADPLAEDWAANLEAVTQSFKAALK
jgi:zinc transport system substrate-binding protein